MRVHVVGVGSLGSLVSFHIRRTARLIGQDANYIRTLPNPNAARFLPYPDDLSVSLRLQRYAFKAKDRTKRPPNSVIVERDGRKDYESGIGISGLGSSLAQPSDHLGVPGSARLPTGSRHGYDADLDATSGASICEQLGYPAGSIDVLLVTGKAHLNRVNFEALAHRITPASTVVLMQNGQGILDNLLAHVFTDPSKRPNFVLANSTHDVWQKDFLHSVHKRAGTIHLGVVPNKNIGLDYERRIGRHRNPEQQRLTDVSDLWSKEDAMTPQEPQSEVQDSLDRRYAKGYEALGIRRKLLVDRSSVNDMTIDPTANMLDINAIPHSENTRTLVSALAILLNLPLDVRWLPIRRYQMDALLRLAVSACIEPLTALAGCRNGSLFGNQSAEHLIRGICVETSAVLQKMVEYSLDDANRAQLAAGDPSLQQDQQRWQEFGYLVQPYGLIGESLTMEAPALHARFQTKALLEEVHRSIRQTGPAFSAMYSAFNKSNAPGKAITDVEYFNGYIKRLGQSLGVPTPINDFIQSVVTLKSTHSATSTWQ